MASTDRTPDCSSDMWTQEEEVNPHEHDASLTPSLLYVDKMGQGIMFFGFALLKFVIDIYRVSHPFNFLINTKFIFSPSFDFVQKAIVLSN